MSTNLHSFVIVVKEGQQGRPAEVSSNFNYNSSGSSSSITCLDKPSSFSSLPSARDSFYLPADYDDVSKLRSWLYEVEDGSLLHVRGRDVNAAYVKYQLLSKSEGDLRLLVKAGKEEKGIMKTDITTPSLAAGQEEEKGGGGAMPNQFTEWEFGTALKQGRSLFLLWARKVECYSIGQLNLSDLLHFRLSDASTALRSNTVATNTSTSTSTASPSTIAAIATTIPPPLPIYLPTNFFASDYLNPLDSFRRNNNFVILSHGFSPDIGPGYAIIFVLKSWLRKLGFHVVVPDFRNTYQYGTYRGRSERCRLVLEEIIQIVTISNRFLAIPNIYLMGHSQGGAASAQVCSEKLACCGFGMIKGLILLGSESPIEEVKSPYSDIRELDADVDFGMQPTTSPSTPPTPPTPPQYRHMERPSGLTPERILLVHSRNDRVISYLQIEQLARHWGVESHILKSHASAEDEVTCAWAEDVHHDFINLDLLAQLYALLEEFLSKCSSSLKP